MVALIREPPRDEGPARRISLRSSHDEVDVSAIAVQRPGGAATARPRASRRSSRSSEIIEFIRREFVLATQGRRCRPGALSRSASRWSTSRRGRRRSRSSRALRRRTRRAHGPRRDTRPVRHRAAGSVVRRGNQAGSVLRRSGQALRHRRRPHLDDVDRRSARGRRSSATRLRLRRRSSEALERLRGEVELPIPAASAVKIGGERAYKLARRGVAVEMPLRRSLVHSLDVIAYTGDSGASGAARQLGHLCPLDRAGPRRALHDAAPDRGRAVRRRRSRTTSTTRQLLPVTDALARLPAEALERVPEAVRAGVLALATRAAGPPRERRPRRPESSTTARAPSRSGRSTACISAIAPSSAPRRPPAAASSRPSSPSTRTREPCSANASSCSRRSSGGSSCSTAAGVEDVLVIQFTPEIAGLEPAEFAHAVPARRSARRSSSPAPGSASGRGARAISRSCAASGSTLARSPSSRVCRRPGSAQLAHAGDVEDAARLLGRPLEVEGRVVGGDRRGGTLGFPTANLAVDPEVLVPGFGIYAGAAGERRAAVSIGVNPHYGGTERRIEAYLLDWTGDLYGGRLVVELWQRLRDEQAFESEAELVDADRPRRGADEGGSAAGLTERPSAAVPGSPQPASTPRCSRRAMTASAASSGVSAAVSRRSAGCSGAS